MSSTSSSFKNDITINKLGGIDARSEREKYRFSEGGNFYIKNGSLLSRAGTVKIDSDFGAPIIAMFQAPLPGRNTILIVQVGKHLWHLVDEIWTDKYTLTSAEPVKSCRFINKLLFVNGTDRVSFDIPTDTYTTLVVEGDTTIPALEYLAAWKFRAFGWMPNTSNSHMLYFCGYDDNSMIDPTVWPPTFTLNVGGTVGSPIFGAFDAGNVLLVLTENSYTPIYGNTEEDFEVSTAGQTNVLRPEVVESINGIVLWVGKDISGELVVNIYTGTEPTIISGPIQEYLDDIDNNGVFTKSFLNQFWLVSPGTTTTRVFVYDVTEGEWFIYDFPFVLQSGTEFGEYLKDDDIYFGTSLEVVKFDHTASTDINDNTINTSFTLGPFFIENRKLKPKTLHITATPENDFSLGMVLILDDNPEADSLDIPFVSVTPNKQVNSHMKLPRDKGYNMSYRISTTDKVNKVNGFTIVYKGKGLK